MIYVASCASWCKVLLSDKTLFDCSVVCPAFCATSATPNLGGSVNLEVGLI